MWLCILKQMILYNNAWVFKTCFLTSGPGSDMRWSITGVTRIQLCLVSWRDMWYHWGWRDDVVFTLIWYLSWCQCHWNCSPKTLHEVRSTKLGEKYTAIWELSWWQSWQHEHPQFAVYLYTDWPCLRSSMLQPISKDPFKYPIIPLIVRSREVSKSRDLYLELSDRS